MNLRQRLKRVEAIADEQLQKHAEANALRTTIGLELDLVVLKGTERRYSVHRFRWPPRGGQEGWDDFSPEEQSVLLERWPEHFEARLNWISGRISRGEAARPAWLERELELIKQGAWWHPILRDYAITVPHRTPLRFGRIYP